MDDQATKHLIAAIAKAMKWRNEHTAHVETLESDATHCFVPCREDLHHPELWKAGSWKWLREFFPENSDVMASLPGASADTPTKH